jgi:NADP-dependent 3-hydroxy acid dehydrogenase YdfG
MAKQQPKSLAGQVVAITGAARGIGRATAAALIRKGARVAIGDLDHEEAQRTAQALGPNAIALALNVTERASVRSFLDETEAQLGPVDVLINNAGIMQIGHVLWEEDDATTQRMLDINVNGVLFGVKEVVPRMLARGRGHVVNVASSAGKGGFPGGGTYCGTKHFVVGASEALRGELRGTGIEVSCVMPVVVNTELASGLQPTRGVKKVEPEDVANEIVDALERPRFDVFVPRSVQYISTAMNVLPRGGREAITRALKADRVLASVDEGQRRAYELRAQRSEPGLEAGPETKQLTS